jgi:hypothetical protein
MTFRRLIFESPVTSLRGAILNITERAMPSRFRLLDCRTWLKEDSLRIYEYSTLLKEGYAAVSYVWRGIASDVHKTFFGVHGAEHADPISLDILETACMASVLNGADLLWLDRLCILQTSEEDKHWQIKNMYEIYRYVYPCLVFPGGLRKLATIFDETPWI